MSIILQIDEEIAALKKKKADIQKKCNHPARTEEKWSISENIMTGREEQHGVYYTCQLCGHKWSEENKR